MRAGAYCVILFVVLAGCAEQSHDDSEFVPPPVRAAERLDANVTGCAGSLARIEAPTSFVRSSLPAAYRPLEPIGGVSQVFLQAWSCEKLAVAGKDIGRGHIAFTFLLVVREAGHGTSPETLSAFLLEAWTNQPEIKRVLQAVGIVVRDGNVTTETDRLPAFQEIVKTRLGNDQSTIYDYQIHPSLGTTERNLALRYFFKDRPTDGSLDLKYRSTESTNYGPGKMSSAPNSGIAKIFSDAPMTHVVGVRVVLATGTLANSSAAGG